MTVPHRRTAALVVSLLMASASACGSDARVPHPTTPSSPTTAGRAGDDSGAETASCWTLSADYAFEPGGGYGGEPTPEAALDLWAAGVRDAGEPLDPAAWTRSTDGEDVVFTQGAWSATFFRAPAGDWNLTAASGCS